MTNKTGGFSKPHTLHLFDSELSHLYCLVMEMSDLVMDQLDQSMQALNDGETKLVQRIILSCQEVNQYQIKIDNEVLEVLARRYPVANDQRTVISISKITVELQNISEEIYRFTRLVKAFFYPKTSYLNSKLLLDIGKIGNMVKMNLDGLMIALENSDSSLAYKLLMNDCKCENELQQGIRHQLNLVMQDPRLIGEAIDIMQMMKAFERCSEHCRKIAEYMVFMSDGIRCGHGTFK